MAVTIVNVNSTTFSIDGVEYLKNFMSVVYGDKVEIVNVYDSSFILKIASSLSLPSRITT